MEKNYVRMEAVIYVEMKEDEKMEEAEDRFLCALPQGMDCVAYRSSVILPDDENG